MPTAAVNVNVDGHVNIKKLEDTIPRWRILRRLRRSLRLRKIHREDAEALRRAECDATLETTAAEVPRTLSEALPEDPILRAEDDRCIMVTECTGTFNVVGCNKAWENLCGYAESEIVGRDSSILQGPDSNRIGLHEAVERLFEDEKPVRCVTTNYRKDGSKFKNLLTMGPIYDAKGKMTHCVAILKDIGK